MQCVLACVAILAWFSAHPEYDAAHRDAVMRQIWTESRFDPCVVNPRSGSSYLHQWVGERRTRLHRFAGSGCPSVEAQMNFMDHELHENARYRTFFDAPASQAFGVLRERYGYGR